MMDFEKTDDVHDGEKRNYVDLDSKVKVRSITNKEMYFKADKFNLKDLDMQLEKHLMRAWSMNIENQRPKEDWEIDLSKLDIKNKIGFGSYSTVYRGSYDNQDVAVKVLNWGEDGIVTATEIGFSQTSFRQEVNVWQKLDHPNVTKFIGASMGISTLKIPSEAPSSDIKACCVIIEYVSGGTLKQYLIKNARKKLSFKTVIQIALDLSRGLSYLHSQKIVHRDVKTDNILIDSQLNLKITDFGVARIEAQNPCEMTGETGTLGYMAPEVLVGQPYNRRCDVYSFGICLWEIYCCDMPPNMSFAKSSSRAARQRPRIPGCCPSSIANIMRKCWDANPKKRPEMNEVVRMLEAIDVSKGGGMTPMNDYAKCFCLAPTRGP